jgi:hypothetical protein
MMAQEAASAALVCARSRPVPIRARGRQGAAQSMTETNFPTVGVPSAYGTGPNCNVYARATPPAIACAGFSGRNDYGKRFDMSRCQPNGTTSEQMEVDRAVVWDPSSSDALVSKRLASTRSLRTPRAYREGRDLRVSDTLPRYASAQRERMERVAGRDRDILLPLRLVGHRSGSRLTTDVHLPQQRAGARIQRVKVPFATPHEQQVSRRRQDAAGRSDLRGTPPGHPDRRPARHTSIGPARFHRAQSRPTLSPLV